jgi:hypothetical protein
LPSGASEFLIPSRIRSALGSRGARRFGNMSGALGPCPSPRSIRSSPSLLPDTCPPLAPPRSPLPLCSFATRFHPSGPRGGCCYMRPRPGPPGPVVRSPHPRPGLAGASRRVAPSVVSPPTSSPVLFSPSDLPQRLVLLVCLMCRPTAVPPSPLTPKCDCPLVPTGVTLFRQPTRLPSRSSPSSCPCLPLHFIPSPIVSLTCRAVPRAASLHVSAPHPPPPPGTFSSRPLDSPP